MLMSIYNSYHYGKTQDVIIIMKIYNYDGKANIIGKRMKHAREHQKLSQEALCNKLQVENVSINQKAISRIECQERFVSDYELLQISKVLKVDIYWLLGEDPR